MNQRTGAQMNQLAICLYFPYCFVSRYELCYLNDINDEQKDTAKIDPILWTGSSANQWAPHKIMRKNVDIVTVKWYLVFSEEKIESFIDYLNLAILDNSDYNY